MLLPITAIIVGLVLLVWSADHFVEGAVAIARHLGVSTLIIGITVIGFGTSVPEIVVSIIAVLENSPDIAIGNALGSNIANIGLVLGITAMLVPIPISSGLVKSEYPLLFIATVVMVGTLYDLALDWMDGLILVGSLVLILVYLVRSHRQPVEQLDLEDNDAKMMEPGSAVGRIVLGLIVLVGSSKLLVWGASNIAHTLGVSELVIGLTVVALGTSLPELATSIASLKKSIPDLAIGNIIGSNLFNSLAVVGIPPLLMGFNIDASVLTRDIPVMVGMTLLLFLLSYYPKGASVYLSRLKGIWLISGFVIYQLYLYYDTVSNVS